MQITLTLLFVRQRNIITFSECESYAAHHYGAVIQVLLTVFQKQVAPYDVVNMFLSAHTLGSKHHHNYIRNELKYHLHCL